MNLDAISRIYFLGIGGIGMSALARYFHLKGKTVSGYDRVPSVVTQGLEALGIPVYYEADSQHLEGQELVIYTPAIPPDHPEWVAIRQQGMPVLKRAQVLGSLTRERKGIAIAGTHGKTTTSTMLAHVLRHAGVACTAFLGGISKNLGSNFVYGESPWVVVEADEYDRSFLQLYPEKALITALDPDHLDIYGTPEEMVQAYEAFAGQIAAGGTLWVHHNLKGFGGHQARTFGVEAGEVRAVRLRHQALTTTFDLEGPYGTVRDLTLAMPGAHNVSNMTGALAIAGEMGVTAEAMKGAVAAFSGIYRRFDVQWDQDGLTYVDDYAHHPAEIEAVLRATRHLFPRRKLWVVFQPHLYTRTRDFYRGFAEALSLADQVILMPIYPARETPIEGVKSEMIAREMAREQVQVLQTPEQLLPLVKEKLTLPGVLLTLGAGDIDKSVAAVKTLCDEIVKAQNSLTEHEKMD